MRATKRLAALCALICFCIIAPSNPVQAETFTFIIKKQEEKKDYRWSLAGWLKTKEKMRLMDLWLALHSPTPYEFVFGGEYMSGTANPGSKYSGGNLFFIAYATIFGLEIKGQTKAPVDYWQAVFRFRVFGFYDQGTNITLHAGVRTRQGTNSFRNALLGVSMSIYIAKFFGIEGSFIKLMDSTPSSTGLTYSATEYDVGAFIEYSFIRFYGKYFTNPTILNGSEVSESGIKLGTKFYF